MIAASSPSAFRRALRFGRELADASAAELLVVLAPEPVVASARAHAHAIPAGEVVQTAPIQADVRDAIIRDVAPAARVVGPSAGEETLQDAIVIVGGRMRHYFETAEQRLARRLADAGYCVIFLPDTARKDAEHS